MLMKRTVALVCLFASLAYAAVEMPAASHIKGLQWLGHASFRLERGGKIIYWDPWQLGSEPHDADWVLITHPHFDHLSAEDVKRISKPETVIVTVADCMEKLKEAGIAGEIRVVKPGDLLQERGIRVQAVPAYNLNKDFHPKEKQWVGFVVEVDGEKIYHAGDTDFIPEMREIKADVALLPVSGTYVMTAEEAAEAAKAMNPGVAVPMHYGAVVGTKADADRFRTLCGGVIVEILEKDKESGS